MFQLGGGLGPLELYVANLLSHHVFRALEICWQARGLFQQVSLLGFTLCRRTEAGTKDLEIDLLRRLLEKGIFSREVFRVAVLIRQGLLEILLSSEGKGLVLLLRILFLGCLRLISIFDNYRDKVGSTTEALHEVDILPDPLKYCLRL